MYENNNCSPFALNANKIKKTLFLRRLGYVWDYLEIQKCGEGGKLPKAEKS